MDKFVPRIPSLQDLPPTRLRVFLCHREVQRTAARTQRHRFFLRKRIRIFHQMICKNHAPSTPKLRAYPKDKRSCSFRDLLRQIGCRSICCFTKSESATSDRLWCRTFVKKKPKDPQADDIVFALKLCLSLFRISCKFIA